MPKLCLTVLFVLALSLSTVNAADVKAPSGSKEIIPDGAKLELLWNDGEFTEGVAVAPDGRIYFSDIPQTNPGAIYRFDPKNKQTVVVCKDSGKSNGLMFDRSGQLIACCGANNGRMSLAVIGMDGSVRDLITRYDGKRFNAPNDLVIHPDGGIYFSDPRYVGAEPIELDHMSVFRFDPKAGSVQRVTTDISKPNGVILSPDANTLYVAETDNGSPNLANPGQPGPVRMTLNAFAIKNDGTLGPRKVIADFGNKAGIDGMTMDQQGHVYGALRIEERQGIVVMNSNGQEQALIPTPSLPTNCCFGNGGEANMLYVTAGGGLYRIRLLIPGYHPSVAPL